MTRTGPAARPADRARPAPARLALRRLALASWRWLWLWLLPACWTGGSAPAATATSAATATGPAAPCPARLAGLVHDAATGAPLAGATVVVETDRGRVAAELTDARGRFETAAVSPPARLRIYHGAHAAWHRLEACQPPLRLGVRLAP